MPEWPDHAARSPGCRSYSRVQCAQEPEWGCPPEWPDDATPQPSAHEQPPPDWAAGAPPGPEWVPHWGCPPLWEVPQARRGAAHLVADAILRI